MKGPSFGSIKTKVSAFLRRKVALFGLSKIILGTPKSFQSRPSLGIPPGVPLGVPPGVHFGVDLESFFDVFGFFFSLTRGFKL